MKERVIQSSQLERFGHLTLFRPMEFPIKFDTVMLGWSPGGWSIVYIQGLQVVISKNIIFLYLKIFHFLSKQYDPDKMP